MSATKEYDKTPVSYCQAPRCCRRFKAGTGMMVPMTCEGGSKKEVWVCSDPCARIAAQQ